MIHVVPLFGSDNKIVRGCFKRTWPEGPRTSEPTHVRSEDDNWLVVSTHLKNIRQIGFIFPKWE